MTAPATSCNHPGSNHRLNDAALLGYVRAERLRPREARILRAIALAAGGAPVQMDARALAARTFASTRTNYRGASELVKRGALRRMSIYGPRRRFAPVYQLAEPLRSIVTRNAPTTAEIRARAFERVMLARELLGRAPTRPRGPSRLTLGTADRSRNPSSGGSSFTSPSCSSGILAVGTKPTHTVSGSGAGPPCPAGCTCADCCARWPDY